jgi:hypothetical protein
MTVEVSVADSVGFLRGGNAEVELRRVDLGRRLLSIAAIVLAGAVVTGVAIREARQPRRPHLTDWGVRATQ